MFWTWIFETNRLTDSGPNHNSTSPKDTEHSHPFLNENTHTLLALRVKKPAHVTIRQLSKHPDTVQTLIGRVRSFGIREKREAPTIKHGKNTIKMSSRLRKTTDKKRGRARTTSAKSTAN